MKFHIFPCLICLFLSLSAFAQVDTTELYNTTKPYGTLDIRIAKSATDYFYLQENITFSFRESAPGVKTNTYLDATSWDSSPYTQGNLREIVGANDYFRMNYRLLFPKNWVTSYSPGYPLIVMMHGAGESGNCWDDKCKFATTSWNPITNNPAAPTDVNSPLLGNDLNLVHGGGPHLTARELAGNRLPDDPSMPSRAFPGFVLFPQNLNGWDRGSVENAIRTIRLVMKKYNIDPNRVYIHGLSDGGAGTYNTIKRAPWLFAAALPMSAINDGGINSSGMAPDIASIPIWTFQGGQDTGPTPSKTEGYVKSFQSAGLDIRYTLYSTLGHGTWNTAYSEPDFFTWILSKNKSNIHVGFNNPNICGTTGAGVNLVLAQGFLSYQWERDGQIIPGATSYSYLANTPGIYRARFSRLSTTPSEQEWNRWSDPVTIGEQSPTRPEVEQIGSIVQRDLNNDKNATLKGPDGFEHYYWYQNGTLVTALTDKNPVTIGGCSSYPCAATGAYTLVTEGIDMCTSQPSKAKYVVMGITNTNPPVPASIISTPTGFTGTAISPYTVALTWNDVSKNERGYEIWRKRSTDALWTMVTLTEEDVTLYHDTGLIPGSLYYYKIRAVNNEGRSDYAPSNSTGTNLNVTTPENNTIPNPPQNLSATVTGINTISLSWEAPVNTNIDHYLVYYGADSISTGSSATGFILTDTQLDLNTNYTLTVRTVDENDRLSYKSNQVTANTYVSGLYYKHSTGAWSDLDDPTLVNTWTNPEFTGTVTNFTLSPRTQEDYFNFEFTGYLYITTGGSYTFQTISDDGSRMFLNNVMIVDNDGLHGNVTKTSAAQTLSAGPQLIDVTYFEYGGGQSLTVQYKGPDTGNAWKTIPNAVLNSGTPSTTTPPGAPTALTATAGSMSQINLSWTPVGTSEFEIYRSLSSNGTYTMLGRISASTYSDTQLTSNTTYFYKVRAVNNNGLSVFTSVVSATTFSDSVAPSQPGTLAISGSGYSNVSLIWNASTDNSSVAGYELWMNDALLTTTAFNGYAVTGLSPDSTYTFYVVAFDGQSNKSAPSNIVTKNISEPDRYYSNGTGALNDIATWSTAASGNENHPSSFSNNGQYFIISNRTTCSMGGTWSVEGTVSKVIVPDDVTLTVDNAFDGRIELTGTGRLNLNHTQMPDLVSVSPESTIEYNVPTSILNIPYGNLVLSGNVNKSFPAGTLTVAGDLTVADGVLLKGAIDNGTRLQLKGNLIQTGTPGFVAPNDGIKLELLKEGLQTITTGGDLYFQTLSTGPQTNAEIINGGSPITLNIGSYNGGGLTLADGTQFNVGNNNLAIIRSASINPNNETGRIAINGGNLSITSDGANSSNLYFQSANNKINYLEADLTGSGHVVFQEDASVSDGIKVKNGILNANDHITLLSDATKTASIQAIEGTGSITGNMKVQRYLSPKGKVYRYISTSVDGVKIADWQNFFPITGGFTGGSTGYTNNPSMYMYDNGEWLVYPPANGDNQAPISRGVGYSAYLRNGTSPITLEVNGNPFQGDIAFDLDADPSSSQSNDGWNLLGNPYASTITWGSTGWTRSGVNTTISVRDNPAGVFKYYDYSTGLGTLTDGEIAAGQSFWVQSISPTPTLIITEQAKSNLQQTLYRQADNPVSHLKMTLKQGLREDHTFIALTENGTDAFDKEFDAVKQQNVDYFNFSTLSLDDASLAINNMDDSFCSKSLNLNLQNVSAGSYSIVFSDVSSLLGVGTLVLHDHFTGADFEVSDDTKYNFSVTSNTNSYGKNRFTLTLTRPAINTDITFSAAEVCGDKTAMLTLKNTQPGAEYFAVNDNSEKISNTVTAMGSQASLEIPVDQLTAGSNIIKVSAGFKGCSNVILQSTTTLTHTEMPAVTAPDDIWICQGSSASLNASGAPAGGYYKWYDNNHVQLSSANASHFDTYSIKENTEFYVAAVTEGGCTGESKLISVYTEILSAPTIYFTHDTLFSDGSGTLQWYRNGEPITGANKNYFKPELSGAYSLATAGLGCIQESEPFEYLITGTEQERSDGFSLIVYPNPTHSNNINIGCTSSSPTPVEVKMFDLVGKPLYINSFNPGIERNIKLTLSEPIRNGVYFITATQGNRVLKKKVIIAD